MTEPADRPGWADGAVRRWRPADVAPVRPDARTEAEAALARRPFVAIDPDAYRRLTGGRPFPTGRQAYLVRAVGPHSEPMGLEFSQSQGDPDAPPEAGYQFRSDGLNPGVVRFEASGGVLRCVYEEGGPAPVRLGKWPVVYAPWGELGRVEVVVDAH